MTQIVCFLSRNAGDQQQQFSDSDTNNLLNIFLHLLHAQLSWMFIKRYILLKYNWVRIFWQMDEFSRWSHFGLGRQEQFALVPKGLIALSYMVRP